MENLSRVTCLVGVYDADGGLRGELRYVVGHLLGRTECALCDVTHSPLRRKRAWDAMVVRLGIPVELVHRNEIPSDVAACVREAGLPCVVARRADGGVETLLDRAALEALDGSVEAFERGVGEVLAARSV
ncbi:hypothetical protein [Paraoerskovia marina]|uniref:hypothetical protein n=1 Tax=Paraoerskovia marina TaxID=545619 RepID=UPI000492689D|nr:hypothetical protein [Paraoerskovia marina]